MSPDELYEILGALGFRFSTPITNTGISWYAWKTADNAEFCDCNEKPPSLCFTPYKVQIDNREYKSVEFSLCADAGENTRCNFKVYGVSWEDAIDKRRSIERMLVMAWNSARMVHQVQGPFPLIY